MTYPQFILFGDSITQYSAGLMDNYSLGAKLADHCERRLDVINRGLSGYNTANAVKIIDRVIPTTDSARVDYLLIAFGANDAVLPGYSGQHVPLQEYIRNTKAIITHPLVKAHNPKILLVTPPPIDEIICEREDKARGYADLTRQQPVTRKYAEAIRAIVKECKAEGVNIELVDLWQAMMDKAIELTPGYVDGEKDGGENLLGSRTKGESGGFRQLLVDGLHFTGAGYKVFYNALVGHVGEKWKEEPETSPSWVFPHWSAAPKI